jgi:putative hemolysin
MIDIAASVNEKFPAFKQHSALIQKTTLGMLRKITHEDEINHFLENNKDCSSFEFIDRIFDNFDFSYSASARSRANIPSQGSVIIIANHPIGSLDGLALLRLVSEVRRDVKIVANDMLMNFSALHPLLLPLDNMGGSATRRSYKDIMAALDENQAVILFPAGEVSRARPQGVRDGAWRSGFLHFARKTQAPILPVYIDAKNSLLFYGASMLFKPLGTALLAHEMFNKQSMDIRFRVGETIAAKELDTQKIADKALIKRLKKHVYKLHINRHKTFITEKTIAHPEDRRALKQELKTAQLLGETKDNKRICLFEHSEDSATIREIGRLREQAFRLVGEGTGAKRDIDRFDEVYRHLVLWDDERLDIAGAYRIGEAHKLSQDGHLDDLYTAELFKFNDAMTPYLHEAIELGRSFVNPNYWGKASLDYLWQGIGAYLRHNPNVRYLMGPVSISDNFPDPLKDLLVFYYKKYYSADKGTPLASAKNPYIIADNDQTELEQTFARLNREEGFTYLQQQFNSANCKFPMLFKQYAALFEEGGFKLLSFSVDPDFGNCIDGLFLADLHQMKASKRKRYLKG